MGVTAWRACQGVVLSVACTAAGLSGCGGPGTDHRSIDLRMAAIQRRELPAGMEQTIPSSRSTLPGGSHANWVHVEFYRPASSGLTAVDNQIVAYSSVPTAQRAYTAEVQRLRRGGVLGSTSQGTRAGDVSHTYPFQPIQAARIGELSAAFSADSFGDEFSFTTRVVVFVRGRYLVFLRVMGVQDQVPIDQVTALARRINSRLGSS